MGTSCADVAALLLLAAAWTPVNSDTWGKADPCGRNSDGASLWGGVGCDAENFTVTSLSVTSGVGPGATLPASLWQLTSLVRLNLSGAALSGPLPSGVGGLTRLSVLDLSVNALNETLPTKLGSLWSLTLLSLAANAFDGSLPTEVGELRNLTSLSVASNALGGSLPAQLGNLTKLVSLDASANAFNGSLSTSLDALSALTSLLLSFNALSGGVPIGLTALSELGVHGNAWMCGFSPSTAVDINGLNCTDTTFGTACGDVDALRALDLAWKTPASGWGAPDPCGRNSHGASLWAGLSCLTNGSRVSGLELRNVSLAGAIPDAVWSLTALANLTLANASLTGELSAPGVAALARLAELDLSENAVSGTLPAELFQLTALEVLDLSASALSGPLPSGVGNLSALRTADLSGCRFNESLPAALANLTSLVTLDARNNSFSGALPNITLSTLLTTLDLSDNQLLSGPLPLNLFSGNDLLPALLVTGNALLCGPEPLAISETYSDFSGARVKPGV